jgi:uncharacterized protein with HEPN domain
MRILDMLQDIEDVLLLVMERTTDVKTADDFVLTAEGIDKLDATTIRLMAAGEEINKINKRTKGELLKQYPEIEWNKVVSFRNFIAHAYFKTDAEDIFKIVKTDVKPLLQTIQKIIVDLK